MEVANAAAYNLLRRARALLSPCVGRAAWRDISASNTAPAQSSESTRIRIEKLRAEILLKLATSANSGRSSLAERDPDGEGWNPHGNQ